MLRRITLISVLALLVLALSPLAAAQESTAEVPTPEITETPLPTEPPTQEATTEIPTEVPTEAPTEDPTDSAVVTEEPTVEPTDEPITEVTEEPTAEATEEITPTMPQAPPIVRAPTTYIVNSTGDADVCNPNPEFECTLRGAITAANANTPDLDTIQFNIAGPGPFVIQPASPLPIITDSVIIDGTTQFGYTDAPVIVLDGSDVVVTTPLPPLPDDVQAVGFNLMNGSSIIRGIVIQNFAYAGVGIIGTQIEFEGATFPNPFGSSINNVIEGNYIGTNAAGDAAAPNLYGVVIYDSFGNTIGSTNDALRNVISGNSDDGVNIGGASATGNTVIGNYIGVDASSVGPLGNGDNGVKIETSPGNTIGGATPAHSNIIAHNTRNGVLIEAADATGNAVRGNSIYNNGALGIDLDPTSSDGDGVTPNDEGDADSGPNNLQNFPVLASAVTDAGSTLVTGTINSTANTELTIEFFANPACDSSDHGEGQVLAGTAVVTTDGAGNASISETISGVAAGAVITATATDSSGNTSEFSECVTVTEPGSDNLPPVADAGPDQTVTDTDNSGAEDVTLDGTGSTDPDGTIESYDWQIGGVSIATGVNPTVSLDVGVHEITLIVTDDEGATDDDTVTITVQAAPDNLSPIADAGPDQTLTDVDNDGVESVTLDGTGSTDPDGTIESYEWREGETLLSTEASPTLDFTVGVHVVTLTVTDNEGATDDDTVTITVEAPFTTFVVNSVNDPGDGTCDETECTLREAINAANGSAGSLPDVIEFDIEGTAPFTIALSSSLPIIINAVVIDGTSQPGYVDTPVIVLDGSGIVGFANGLLLRSGGHTVRGLSIVNFAEAAGIRIEEAGNSIIEGNYLGITPAGIAAPNRYGLNIDSPNNTIGGTTAGAANIISGNSDYGVVLFGDGATGNTVQGNYIGTDAVGMIAVPNNAGGVVIDANNNTLGGTEAGEGNLISGNNVAGVIINSDSRTNNRLHGNFIGTDATGTSALANNGPGVGVGANDNFIGGTNAGEGNIIRFNTSDGVVVYAGSGNRILGNSISDNGALGIDLDTTGTGNGDGVTPNDPGDSDSGPNGLQNYPELESAVIETDGTVIFGVLLGTPDTEYRIEFFTNDTCDSSGHGEGQTFIGFTTTTTDGTGNGSVIGTLDVIVNESDFITATATDASGNTSEFSECIVASSNIRPVADAGPDQTVEDTDNDGVEEVTLDGSASTDPDGIIVNAIWYNEANEEIATGSLTPTVTLPVGVNVLRLRVIDDFGSEDEDTVTITVTSPPPTTYIVNSTEDPGDGTCDETECTLREAINAANATFGPDIIDFNIEGDVPFTIQPASPLPTITSPVTIDGTSQPGYVDAPLVELDGTNVAGEGLVVSTNDSIIRGLVINRFSGAGILLQGTGNTLEQNYIGTDVTGASAAGNEFGVAGEGDSNLIRNNLISGNLNSGILLITGEGNIIQGNLIGANATGDAALGNGSGDVQPGFDSGVTLQAPGTIIGGNTPETRNLISGNLGYGIAINADDVIVQGNYIGTDVTGTVGIANGVGVLVFDESENTLIGGTDAQASNIIAFNTNEGILVAGDVTGTSILRNSIFDNGGLGIDLGGDGVTPNDAGDADTGANNLQNFPVLTSATATATTLNIEGTLNSTADTTFRIEFFENDACDSSGHGEGQQLLGFVEVTTDGDGNAAFDETLTVTIALGQFITATATNLTTNDTSEFSACVETAESNLPGTPTDLVATAASPTSIDLTWTDNATDETGYSIERSADGVADWVEVGTVEADQTTFTDTGLTCETEYFYRVAAVRDEVSSDYSNIDSATTLSCADLPAAPTDLVATAVSPTSIDLTWTDNATDETGYSIERSADGVTDWVEAGTVEADQTTFTDTGLTCETEYFYRVAAVRDDVTSDYSNTDSATTLSCSDVPAAPTDLVARGASSTSTELEWTDNATDETGYSIERSADGVADWVEVGTTGADETTFTDTGLTCETEYFYRVAAVRDETTSDYSNIDSATTFSCVEIILRGPRDEVFVTNRRPNFTWRRNTQAERYRFELATDRDFTDVVRSLETANNRKVSYKPARNEALDFGIYYWRVMVDTGTGTFLPASEVRQITITQRPPRAPKLSEPRNNTRTNDATPTLMWQSVTGDGGPFTYQIQIATRANFRDLVREETVDALEFTPDTELDDGRYFWRVRALNALGVPGKWSAKRSFTVDTVPPGVPVLRAPADGSSSRNTRPSFRWRSVQSANFYRLEVNNVNDFSDPNTLVLVQERRQLSYRPPANAALTPGTYFWRVQARDAAGNWGEFSESFSLTINP